MAAKEESGQFVPNISSLWLVSITVVILGIAGLFVLIFLHPQVLLILFAGLFLGIAIKPAVEWMARRGLAHEVGAALIFIFTIALVGIFISVVLPLLVTQTVNLATALTESYTEIRQSLLIGKSLILRQVVQTLPDDLHLLQPMLLSQSSQTGMESSMEGLSLGLGQVFGVGLGILFVIFLAVNWSVEGDRILHTMLFLSNQRREFVREILMLIEHRISGYLTGLGLLSLIVGIMALIGYLLIGLPYAVVLAIFAGIMEAVPVVGPAIGAVPAIIVALSISPEAAVAVVAVSVVIQAAENIWIFPRVMGSSVGVPPFVTLIFMLGFSSLFGIAGAFIAIPLAAVIRVLFETFVEYQREHSRDSIGRDRMSAVRYEIQELVADIKSQIRSRDFEADDELLELEESLEMIASDLDVLLQRSNGERTS